MLKKFIIVLGILLFFIYALFLILPFFVSEAINAHSDDISRIVEENTGFKLETKNIKLVTTPKLTAGLKVEHVDTSLPTGDKFFSADNIQIKLSLIPILWKRIEIDLIGADTINLTLKVKKDGHFILEDYLTGNDNIIEEQNPENATIGLPFGIKLSNKLPDIRIKKYNISFIDNQSNKSYSIVGNDTNITDFILNKKIKISSNGSIILDNREQFKYDIKLFNKIMPDVDLNELVFNPQPKQNTDNKNTNLQFNIIEIFNALYQNKLSADLITDIKTFGTLDDINITGLIKASGISLAVDGKKLPPSNFDMVLKNKEVKVNTKLYTASDEITELFGDIINSKHPKIDLTCKSNAKFNSIIKIANSILKTFAINDLETLSATGSIDADFNIKSDFKKIKSSGYIKIPDASIVYKLYNIIINDIFADIRLNDNIVEFKDARLKILGHPLKIKGTVSHDAIADICIKADDLQIKGLLLTAGQFSLLKENKINSGTISLDIDLIGKLDKIVPKIFANINNLDVKNIPSETSIILENSQINLITDGKAANGKVDITGAKVLNPMAKVSAPKAEIELGDKDINIQNTYIMFDNSKIDVSGKVSDYMSKNINFDIKANGKLLASDLLTLIPKDYKSEVKAKGALPINVHITGNYKVQNIVFELKSDIQNHFALLTIDDLKAKETIIKGDVKLNGDTLKLNNTGIFANGNPIAYLKGSINDLYKTQKMNFNFSTVKNVTMVIPYFAKSSMNAGMDLNIHGTVINPLLKGSVNIPILKMPEMNLVMKDLNASLNGTILQGKGTLKEFQFDAIKAENLSSDFELKNDVFYLNKLSGDAFKGKINGDISYNLLNTKTKVNLSGKNMDALKAIEGAAGIKNALSGTLGFSADVTTSGATDIEMIKNLNGSASFDIQDGQLLNIGRFENFLLAKNLLAIPAVKMTVDSVTSLTAVKNTSKFKTLDGSMIFTDGWAQLNPVRMSGEALSYYITGKYNLVNGTANVIVLGRLSGEVVKLLGVLGDLSVAKLTSYIPSLGGTTQAVVKLITTSTKDVNTDNIPALSSGNTNFRDFQVEFNGGVESTTSVKSFKWLSECDTSEIDVINLKEAIQNTQKAIEENKKQNVEKLNKTIEEHKQNIEQTKKQIQEEQQKQAEEAKKQIQETKQQLKDTKEELQNSANEIKNSVNELKNLFKFQEQEPSE